ncbi:hypothetical protein D3C72_1730450 [compost metagenome]
MRGAADAMGVAATAARLGAGGTLRKVRKAGSGATCTGLAGAAVSFFRAKAWRNCSVVKPFWQNDGTSA